MALLSAVSSVPASFQLSHFSPRTVQYTSRTCAFLLSSKTRRVCRSFASCGGASTSSLFGHRLVGNSVVSVSNFGASSGAVFGKACVLGFAAMGSSASTPDAASMEVNASSTAGVGSKSIHGFVVQDIDGNEVELSKYKGKVLLVVNVASQCGLTTSNYKELAEIYSKYKDQDFEILAFPCNQFGSQEPGSNEQIKEFACTRFKAEYPIFNKIDVNGANAAPLYKFLKEQKGGGLLGDSIKWNFAKFLVDKDGNVVDRYAPTTSPSKIEKDIKKLL